MLFIIDGVDMFGSNSECFLTEKKKGIVFIFLMANCGESTLDVNCSYKVQSRILRDNLRP